MAGRGSLETVEWIDYRDFSPEEFLEECNDFPQMVQINEGFYGDGEMWSFSSGQIFKIHGIKTQEKVVTTVEGGRDTPGSKVEKLHIPLNYGGHFEVLPSNTEETDVVYNSVKELAKNFPRYACADCDISVTSEVSEGVRLHQGDQIELLETAKRPTKKGLKPFLKCLVNGKEYLLPHSCRGRFIALPDENSYTISDIIKRFPLPKRVQFFGGYINYCSPEVMESLGYSFDGVLRLEGTTLEKYLVATTQGLTKKSDDRKKDLLVIPIKAKIKFLVAKGLFERSSEYETVLSAFSRDFDVDKMAEHPYMTFELAPLAYPDDEEPPPPLARGPSEEPPPVPGADEKPPVIDRSSKPESLVKELTSPRASASSQAETEDDVFNSDANDYESLSDDDYDAVAEDIVPPGKDVTGLFPPTEEEGEYELIDDDSDTPPDNAVAPRPKAHSAQPKQENVTAQLKNLFAKRGALPTKTTPTSQDPTTSKRTPPKLTLETSSTASKFGVQLKSTPKPLSQSLPLPETAGKDPSSPSGSPKFPLKPPSSPKSPTKPLSFPKSPPVPLASTLPLPEKTDIGPPSPSPVTKSPKPPVTPRRHKSASPDQQEDQTTPGSPYQATEVSPSHRAGTVASPTKLTGLVSPLKPVVLPVKPAVVEGKGGREQREAVGAVQSPQTKATTRQREVFSSLSDVPADLNQLTIGQVTNCLQLLNMAEYVPRFERDQVDGCLMCDLDQEMLSEMGVSRVHSMKLKKFIQGWRPNADN